MRIRNVNVRPVPRLYDLSSAKAMPGSYWYPNEHGDVVIRCSRLDNDEHTTVLLRKAFDEDGILSFQYSDFICGGQECDWGGRLWLIDFHGRQPVACKTKAGEGT